MKFHIHNGNIEGIIAYLRKLPVDKEYDCTIEKHKIKRSLDQNSLYWMWIKCITDEIGMDKDAVHFEFKSRFIGTEKVKGFDCDIIRPISTSTLNTAQFTAYLDKIQQFAASELGIVLPSPDDGAFEAFEEYYNNRI